MQKKILKYLKKNLFNNISKNYRYFINVKDDISVKYFFWLNNDIFSYTTIGFCIKKVNCYNFHMDNFVLYFFLRNIKVNQIFFTNNPFIVLCKKKKNVNRFNKRIFLL